MFDGESKNRKINLSGKKNVILNKNTFIEKARKEKEINLAYNKRKNSFKVISSYVQYKASISRRQNEIHINLLKRVNDVILLEKIVSQTIYKQALEICLYEFSLQSCFIYSKWSCYNYYKCMKFEGIYAPVKILLDIIKLHNKLSLMKNVNYKSSDLLNSEIYEQDLRSEKSNKGSLKESDDDDNNKVKNVNIEKNKIYYRHNKEIDILVNHLDILIGNYYAYNLNIYREYYKGGKINKKSKCSVTKNIMKRTIQHVSNSEQINENQLNIRTSQNSDDFIRVQEYIHCHIDVYESNMIHIYYLYNFILNNQFIEELGNRMINASDHFRNIGKEKLVESIKKISDYIILTIDGLITVIKHVLVFWNKDIQLSLLCESKTKLLVYVCDIIYIYFYILKIQGNKLNSNYVNDLKNKINILLDFLLLYIARTNTCYNYYYIFISLFKYNIFELFASKIDVKDELIKFKKLLILVIKKNLIIDTNIMKNIVYSIENHIIRVYSKKSIIYSQETSDKKNVSGINIFKNLLLFIYTNKEIMNDNIIDLLLEIYMFLPLVHHPYIYTVSDDGALKQENANSSDILSTSDYAQNPPKKDITFLDVKANKENSMNSFGYKENEEILFFLQNKEKKVDNIGLGHFYNKNIIESLIDICKRYWFMKLDSLLFLLIPFRSIHIDVFKMYRNYYDYIKNIKGDKNRENNVKIYGDIYNNKKNTKPIDGINFIQYSDEYITEKNNPSTILNNNFGNIRTSMNVNKKDIYNINSLNIESITQNKVSNLENNIFQYYDKDYFFSPNNLVEIRDKKDVINNKILIKIKKILVQNNIHIYLIKKIYLSWMENKKNGKTDNDFLKNLYDFPYFDNNKMVIYLTSFCFLFHYYIITNMYNKLIDINNFKYSNSFMLNPSFKKISKLLILSLWIILKKSINTISIELENMYINQDWKQIEELVDDISEDVIYNDENEQYEKECEKKEQSDIDYVDRIDINESETLNRDFITSISYFSALDVQISNIIKIEYTEVENETVKSCDNVNNRQINSFKCLNCNIENILEWLNDLEVNGLIFDEKITYCNNCSNYKNNNLDIFCEKKINDETMNNLRNDVNNSEQSLMENINENNKRSKLSNFNYNRNQKESAYTHTMINYYLYNSEKRGLGYILPKILKNIYEINKYLEIFDDNFFVIKDTYNLLKNRFNIIDESNNISYNNNNYDEDSSLFLEKNDIYINKNIKYVTILANYLLRRCPFTIPFHDRLLIFYNLRNKSKESVRDDTRYNILERKYNYIRRTNIFEDGFITLNKLDSINIKQNIRIAFRDKNGNDETGIDGGGLFKEFMLLLCREIFHNKFILFQYAQNNTLFPKQYKQNDNLILYEFSGKIVGKAIYERILIESVFNNLFLNLLLHNEININDIHFFDKELFNSLLYIQNTDDVESLALTFCTYENKNPDFLSLSQYNEIKNYFLNLSKRTKNYDNINNQSGLNSSVLFFQNNQNMYNNNINTFFNIINNLDVLINTIDRNISTISRNEVYLNSISLHASRNSGSINENENISENNLNMHNTIIPSISEGYINTITNKINDEMENVDEYSQINKAESYEENNFNKNEFDCIDLIKNGRNINVTNKNKRLYIKLYIDYKYNKLIQKKTQHFLKGLSQLIPIKWLKLFSAHELKILISGNDKCFDVNDLRNNIIYSGGYNENSKTIINLFEILNNFTSNEKSLFLMFVTSCSRSPLLGFQELYPKFCISRITDNTRLPTSSTCVNLLKLPDYETKEILYKNLITAINGTQGFDLS
ncbi:ubiquitin-protein ligase, putative [Plasmodium berghei]|uniref:HECT-type E3 ubiquitin transferase n=2 Tax=Plasmodium berghei TaxID=5821 RepID=A0A509AQ31_PLABA|nr:ubiquitin-protein ligase, putative [Plasmodium berghei ANKA]CXI44047.1 ubiquitin-protein ligase, putative [Plasmodium berghei]SCM22446.1 ubiquitin-protein ligase, putative [Plasmodium berghei]SCN25455.1 ubiquitin-protein ligase, putative [Plasmodium berghei]SCO60419.1 ubiquitin-protein ligase, putative [Plasmodium berghei]SCO62207.1 ubiquitin-protein ligase, putative [Plasmodium berghei]|eukprot:XP_034421637.1 ubiquitin-protein ligase, putative [Plasmodium berghei ANKA]